MRTLIQVSITCVAMFVLLFLHIDDGLADGGSRYHHFRHHTYVAYVESAPYYGPCRIGWWQTLRFGHVRPYWGEWCR
jgi:hypothetical protein